VQGWYQLIHDLTTGAPYLGIPCSEVNNFNFEPHPTSLSNFILQDDSEPETPFTPSAKGKQRQDSDINNTASLSSSNLTNEQLREAKKDATLIQQSPIGTKTPIPLSSCLPQLKWCQPSQSNW
jgi:hypothetical protein